MPRKLVAAGAALLLVAGIVWWRSASTEKPATDKLAEDDRTFDTNDPMRRACDLADRVLLRIWRGHHDAHSEDITTVPHFPNYSGSFNVTSHSGPWDYVQTIPLVLYGPGFIEPTGPVDEFASITDVYATAGDLTGVSLPRRESRSLVAEPDRAPKLIVTVVWDGIGRNTLERHPDAWPNLKRLEREGTSYLGATVGSSPSITPATHASLGTGVFPRDHGVTAIEFRTEAGDVRSAFAGKDPADLQLSTFADEIDRSLDGEPRVGMLAWKSWHMGMLGHGSSIPGGDADEMILINTHGDLAGDDTFYSFPASLKVLEPRLEELAAELDESDGQRDGEWRGRDPLEKHDNPAWVRYQNELLLEMLKRGAYGSDDMPDLFFTNFKVTDIVSHQYSMDSADEAIVLRAQDEALGELVDYLDESVGDYVVVLTSDHGNTPSPKRSGAWPIQQGQLQEDVDAHFEIEKGSLIEQTTAVGPFLNADVMRAADVSESDIAGFLNGYTIRDNWADAELPAGYEERGEEHLFAAAFPSDEIDKVMDCAFQGKPPPDLDA